MNSLQKEDLTSTRNPVPIQGEKTAEKFRFPPICCYTFDMPDDYVIGSGLSEQELGLASWWVRHRIALRDAGYGALVILSALCWGYVLWILLDSYVISYPREQRIAQHIANDQLNLSTLQNMAPQPVQSTQVETFPTTGNRMDFLVELTNPNPLWWAEFTYHFNADGDNTPQRQGFILPQSQRYVTELGWQGKTVARAAQLQVDDIRWHHVNPNQVQNDYASFAANRLQLQFKDVKYENNLQIGNRTIGQTSFTLVNTSGYGFWDVDVTAVVFRGGSPAGVTRVNLQQVKPGESRPITIDWFDNLPGITRTDLRADVNILDPNSYLPSEKF